MILRRVWQHDLAWSFRRSPVTVVAAALTLICVGAALLATDGSVTEGCNVENASFPAGMCAERSAVAAAVARGIRAFDSITIATEAEEPTPPCGICRQVLEEFSPHLLVVSVTSEGREARWTLDELLPRAFTPKSLDRR